MTAREAQHTPKRRFADAPDALRCKAVVTLADGTTADCGRHAKHGALCTQHAIALNADLLAALEELTAPAFVERIRGSAAPAIYCRSCDSTYNEEDGFQDGPGVVACPYCADEANQQRMDDAIDRARAAIARARGGKS